MISIDTNLLLYALHERVENHQNAKSFLNQWIHSANFALSELVLAELYQLLRNPAVFGREVSAKEAVGVIQKFRQNPKWLLIENAPVMDRVWSQAARKSFSRRRLFDVRLGLTLRHHGVTHFATANVKDFEGLGFEKVWNPLTEDQAP
jgi:hypothetical protein